MAADRNTSEEGPARGALCPGCGAAVDAAAGAAAGMAGASPGCWAAYGDLVAREYGEWANPPVHRLTVAAYAAQHAVPSDAKAVQSLAVHLITLLFTTEHGVDVVLAPREIGRAVADPSEFRWLQPPADPGWMTIVDVRGARDVREHTARVQRWARSVWEAWSPHHDVIRRWSGR